MHSKLIQYIPSEQILENEPMKKHTSFKIGGNADYFVKIRNIEEIKNIIRLSREENIPLHIIGNGSNLLVRDEGIRGIVAKICTDTYEILEENKIRVDAGMLNSIVSKILLDNSLSGFEFASGIPGTIGGAITMNAGAYGSQMEDIVECTRYISMEDKNLDIKEISNKEHNFSYRYSRFKEEKVVIIDTVLNLRKANQEDIRYKIEELRNSRMEKQPIDKPSAGSTFKRGEDFITAKLIDEAGLKGFSVGGAQVSLKHAGFIVNNNNATAEDVINLIKTVQEKVYEKFNKKIELEIEIIG